MKNKLIDYVRKQYRETWLKNQVAAFTHRFPAGQNQSERSADRFRTPFRYLQACTLAVHRPRPSGQDCEQPRLSGTVPLTGKAHPHDGAGQGLIKRIIEISRRPEFLGKIIFLENYDMQLARRLVSGVDIWLNTPTRPLEASGTSGEGVDERCCKLLRTRRLVVGRLS